MHLRNHRKSSALDSPSQLFLPSPPFSHFPFFSFSSSLTLKLVVVGLLYSHEFPLHPSQPFNFPLPMDRNAQSSSRDPKGKGRVLKTSTTNVTSDDEEGEDKGRFLSSPPPPSTEDKPRVISSPPPSSSTPAARRAAVAGAAGTGGVLCQADRCTADFTDAKRLVRTLSLILSIFFGAGDITLNLME